MTAAVVGTLPTGSLFILTSMLVVSLAPAWLMLPVFQYLGTAMVLLAAVGYALAVELLGAMREGKRWYSRLAPACSGGTAST